MSKKLAQELVVKFITTQRKLAAALNITPEHLSFAKNTRRYSPHLVISISKVTGISPDVLLSGTKKQINRAFRQYFDEQKLQMIFRESKGVA